MEDRIFEVAEVKTAETLAVRIRTTVRNTQKIMLDAAISIGQDLIEAKELVDYGEWENWLENSVGFSQSTANKYMQISREYGDGAKSELIPILSYSKALKLLAVPDEDLEEFIADNDIEDMTVKELEEKIKKIQTEKADSDEKAEKLEDDLLTVKAEKEDLVGEIEGLQAKIAELESSDTEASISPEQQKELDKAKKDLEKAEKKAKSSDEKADKLQKEIDQLKESRQKAIEEAKAAALEEAKAEAKKESQEEIDQLMKTVDEANKAKTEAEKKLANSSNEDVMKCKILIDQMQSSFNGALAVVEDIEVNDKEKAAAIRGGLHAILGQLQEKL